ncbi:MAG: RsmD family RNA methyltransferase [Candidatus Omnitrophica bacterium]|nr:RsmD family RNA methyltransferase [Candidatus Omnitrophota bacterium]MBU1091045.1 RsmD family RNA methyltransferase [Candidatus Omnitrophota bacterium]MBU1905395.1 RsmD family RNA methyltransferase [Candidatus Omnitrophota bacterium]
MRITTGKYRGRVLKTSKEIRPTQEKVRKAVFDILGDIEGLTFLELFAGSGAIGFEAVSRGVRELTLVENNRICFELINKNIEYLQISNCMVFRLDVERAINNFYRDKKKFDIIFLDPPYYQEIAPRLGSTSLTTGSSGSRKKVGESLGKKTLQMLGAYDILAPCGLVIVQHFKKDNLSDSVDSLTILKQATYGDTALTFYRKV